MNNYEMLCTSDFGTFKEGQTYNCIQSGYDIYTVMGQNSFIEIHLNHVCWLDEKGIPRSTMKNDYFELVKTFK